MTYIAVDFEWNQAQSSKQAMILEDGNKLSGEIIQIGAVKLNENLEVESVFKTEIKPEVYTEMNGKVSELTGITAETLKNAPPFSQCIKSFEEWCEPNAVFLTWGVDDIRILKQNCNINGINSDFCNTWYNLQVFFNMQTGTGSKQKSLSTAVEYFNIQNTLKAHDALNDARYTAMIAQKLDIKRGIAEYPGAKCPLCGIDGVKTVFKGIKSRKAALTNKEICSASCPDCGMMFNDVAPFVRVNRYKYISIAKCKNHGEFVIKLKITSAKDSFQNINVCRMVRELTEQDKNTYNAMLEKELNRNLEIM